MIHESASDDFDTLLPFQLADYIFLEKIGNGSFAKCYKVQSLKYQDQFFAAKVSPLEDTVVDNDGNLCESEIAAMMSLNHPNIIRFYDFFITDSKLVVILELCESGTIEDELEKNGPMCPSRFWTVGKMIANALLFCHQKKIAHRDIKPANIFLDIYNRPKLADFGLSSLMHQSIPGSKSSENLSNITCGTPDYIAPEVVEGDSYNVFKADVYALGITFYEMLVGRKPNLSDLCQKFSKEEEKSQVTNQEVTSQNKTSITGKKKFHNYGKSFNKHNRRLMKLCGTVQSEQYHIRNSDKNLRSIPINTLTDTINSNTIKNKHLKNDTINNESNNTQNGIPKVESSEKVGSSSEFVVFPGNVEVFLQDLISKMLRTNPNERPDMSEIAGYFNLRSTPPLHTSISLLTRKNSFTVKLAGSRHSVSPPPQQILPQARKKITEWRNVRSRSKSINSEIAASIKLGISQKQYNNSNMESNVIGNENSKLLNVSSGVDKMTGSKLPMLDSLASV
ncbi:hypothetical protein TRFO_09153 [Tritrichomonas foetus]|uniref:Protein kinase domain-containing protein n=1 Tax=Tritrichomonas foetus TaxID=1144522 RepID=A0A1J4JK98_9EUKA|nr:hypothetical protein TRFO_09153 [Tritrichomonas foetus]|eukprot:OHS97989.1 hypothetical protein TRFO_09153 [Tritrichomonas foetus]